METLDSGIGSRSPTPDCNLSHSKTSKVVKVATHTRHHINNNIHKTGNPNSDESYNNKAKGSDVADGSSTNNTASATTTATGNGGSGVNGGGRGNGNSSHNNQGNNTSSNNSKTYHREFNNHHRHSSGHQYKKHNNSGYGYTGNNTHYYNNHRYNGNGQRYYGNKHYSNTANHHHHNQHYQNQSYQHHQYSHQNHYQNHSQSSSNNSNINNSNGNVTVSATSNGSSNNSHSNSHQLHHNNGSHMNHPTSPYFTSHSGAQVPPNQNHHLNHNRHTVAAPPHVFISSDPNDSLSWSRRGGENTNNANWSSPSLDAIDSSSSSAAVPINLNLNALNKGFYSPSPQHASPTSSPSTTDSSDAYSLQEEPVSVSAGTPSSNSRTTNNIDMLPFGSSANGSSIADQTLNGSIGPSSNDSCSATAGSPASATVGFPFPPQFHYHPQGVYTYPNTSNHLLTSGGRGFSPQSHHHQLISQGLLMAADSSYTIGKADSSISNNGTSDKALEWSEDGMLFSTLWGAPDRSAEDYSMPSTGIGHPDRGSATDILYSPYSFPNHFPQTNKKRFYNGTGTMSGKLSPLPQNHRYHHHQYPRKPAFGLPREWFDDLDPEEYVRAFSKFGEVKERPPALNQNPQSDSLSEGIWLKFVANQQTTETFRKKMELWRDVSRILRVLNLNYNFRHDPRNFPQFGLQVVGSTMSGFGSNTSDVDMCLLVRGTDVDQRYEAVDKLQVLHGALSGTQWLDNVELIYAKVPILKFRDPKRCLEVDLNCNNFVGIRNTHLLYSYSQADWRLKPLVLVVKLWAHYHGINDAKNMTISSYSLVLMVIHFLQCGVEEPVLPILQEMHPQKFNNTIDILSVKINEVLPSWQSKNTENIGNLLIQFLEYYSRKFDYSENAVSVRTGGTIPIKIATAAKSPKNDPHQWKYLCIEEPFDRTNTARSVYDRDTFDKIVGIFNVSYQRLLASRNLESIFTQISETDARNMSVLIR